MTKESQTFTPQDLLKDLKYVREEAKNTRLLVLYLDLYVEYFVRAIYKKVRYGGFSVLDWLFRFLEGGDTVRFRVRYLARKAVIDEELVSPILLIYKLRCELVHNLRPDENLLRRWILQHKPPIEDPTGVIRKSFENLDPWEKIQIYLFPVVTRLYHCHEGLMGRKPKYTIAFQLNPKTFLIRMDIVDYEDFSKDSPC